jgi:ATP-dependent Zn protease
LKERRDQLERLAKVLLEKEVVDGEELKKFVAEVGGKPLP